MSANLCNVVLEHGADVNAVDHRHRTPITKAIALGNTALIDVLLKHNAHLGMNDKTAINKLMTTFERKKSHVVTQHRDKHALFQEPAGNKENGNQFNRRAQKKFCKKT